MKNHGYRQRVVYTPSETYFATNAEAMERDYQKCYFGHSFVIIAK